MTHHAHDDISFEMRKAVDRCNADWASGCAEATSLRLSAAATHHVKDQHTELLGTFIKREISFQVSSSPFRTPRHILCPEGPSKGFTWIFDEYRLPASGAVSGAKKSTFTAPGSVAKLTECFGRDGVSLNCSIWSRSKLRISCLPKPHRAAHSESVCVVGTGSAAAIGSIVSRSSSVKDNGSRTCGIAVVAFERNQCWQCGRCRREVA